MGSNINKALKVGWFQQNMSKFLIKNLVTIIFFITVLSACVSQQYKADNTPVVVNQANDKEIAMTRVTLGLGYLKMGNMTQAKLNFEKAKRAAPNLVQVYTAFAHYYDTVGEVDLTIAAYKKALSIKADDADTLNNYGVFLCRQGRIAEAKKQLLKAIQVPSYLLVSQSYENIALCQLKENNFIDAEKYLKKSITHSPNNASALVQMVRLQYAKGDYKAAETYLSHFEKSTRRFKPEPLALAFKLYSKQGRNKTAKSYAGMLVKMFPQSFEAKQYIVNGLAHIEADSLAERYQLQHLTKNENEHKKKRVVKLSPKKAPSLLKKTNPKNTTTKLLLLDHLEASKATERNLAKVVQEPAKVLASTKKNNTAELMMTLPVHVVGKNDSLFSISTKYNIRMKSLRRWNNFSETPVLHIGDVIYLTDPKKAVTP